MAAKRQNALFARGSYIVWPGGETFRTLSGANRRAKRISTIDVGGKAYVGDGDTEIVRAEWREGKKFADNPTAKRRNIFGLGKKPTYRVTRAPGRSNETTFKGARVWQTWPEGFKTSADPDSTFDTLKDAKAFISWQQRNPGKLGKAFKRCVAGLKRAKKNPSTAAAEVYEEFHGRPSSEIVTVSEKIHYHKNLAALGELRNLVVLARDGAKVTLSRFKKAILCTNEQKNQLFVRGGDQAVDVREFGIRTPHEVETLGKVLELAYFTRKDHLGDEGGTALYFHVAGETNANGKRKMAGWSPDLIYRVRDEALEFSGGSYTIRAEGVDK